MRVHYRLENSSLREELETARSAAEATRLELEEKMAQAITEITLLHHTLRGLTNELHAALDDQVTENIGQQLNTVFIVVRSVGCVYYRLK